jgi:hypothetical protein
MGNLLENDHLKERDGEWVAKMGEWNMVGAGSGSCSKRVEVGASIDASSQELETYDREVGRKLAPVNFRFLC